MNIEDLPKVISELSLGMNHQVLEIKNLANNLIQLKQYQVHNKWGIKILINSLDENNKNQVIKVLNGKMIDYQIHLKQEKRFELDINCNSNLVMVMDIIRLLFSDFYRLKDTPQLTCSYKKRSVLTN